MMSIRRGPPRAVSAAAVMVAAVVLPVAGTAARPAAASSIGARTGLSGGASQLLRRTPFPGRPPVLLWPRQPADIVGNSLLNSVFCTSMTSCWAVGNDEINNVGLNQILHYNGTKWSRVTAPQPGGTAVHDISELSSVRCTSPANCWAVGSYGKSGAALSQALHWNGSKWSQKTTPSPGGTLTNDFSELMDVSCTSAGNCWADGEYGTEARSDEVSLNLVLHWNGSRWSHVGTPNPAGTKLTDTNGLEAIRCPAARDCWGVGADGTLTEEGITLDNEILHWNGSKWRTVTVPSPGKQDKVMRESGLDSLSCTSASRCWVVGADTGTNRFRNETLHWNGQHWRLVSAPDPASGTEAFNLLSGVSCTADTNCWAVGTFEQGGAEVSMNEVLHWTGHQWLRVTAPEPAGTATDSFNTLLAVRCVSAADCWAAGDTQGFAESEVNEILHWTGRKWIVAG
jgi:hypothetical protein